MSKFKENRQKTICGKGTNYNDIIVCKVKEVILWDSQEGGLYLYIFSSTAVVVNPYKSFHMKDWI